MFGNGLVVNYSVARGDAGNPIVLSCDKPARKIYKAFLKGKSVRVCIEGVNYFIEDAYISPDDKDCYYFKYVSIFTSNNSVIICDFSMMHHVNNKILNTEMIEVLKEPTCIHILPDELKTESSEDNN